MMPPYKSLIICWGSKYTKCSSLQSRKLRRVCGSGGMKGTIGRLVSVTRNQFRLNAQQRFYERFEGDQWLVDFIQTYGAREAETHQRGSIGITKICNCFNN
eukprot:GABU01003238.1.p2 GENE.GABU01003238.1~~GABU01003238.1.p2  ORF type:complete len:101 (+),score=7.01 GABU01003238.1:42-344(+)